MCGPCKTVNHTSWVAVVTPTDRPKSVHNRCVNELFLALLVLSLCPFDISVSAWVFGIGLSQISSFLYQYNSTQLKSFCYGLVLNKVSRVQ